MVGIIPRRGHGRAAPGRTGRLPWWTVAAAVVVAAADETALETGPAAALFTGGEVETETESYRADSIIIIITIIVILVQRVVGSHRAEGV